MKMAQPFKELHWSRDIEVDQYFMPATLSEALGILADHKGTARVIAGGTDVIPELRKRDYEVRVLVDITRLPEMDYIRQESGSIAMGGLVTHAQVTADPLIMKKAALLADAARAVGSPQIRNIATVAGNLISGQPAADTSIPLLALDAVVTIASLEGDRTVPLTEFFLDMGRTALDPKKEILTKIEFQGLGENQGGCYLRLSKRKALTLPMLVCAVKVAVDKEKNTISKAAIALGPVAPTPFRRRSTEEDLKGAPIDRQTVEKAAEGTAAYCTPRDSLLRGSCDYRDEMVKVFVKRGLSKALAQAGTPVS